MTIITVDEARALYGRGDSVHDFDHVLRVVALAERIGRAEGADMEILQAAALLHDIARAEGDQRGEDHAALGAERVRELLRGQPPERVEAIVHAIAAHRFRLGAEPRTLEARVLFDADKLDAIGAIGIARAFAYGGLHAQPLWADLPLPGLDPGAPHGNPDVEDDAHTPVHEFVQKLSRLKERMHTRTGRAIAEERHQYMLEFYARLRREVKGEK